MTARLLTILGHPAWTGVGALASIFAFALAVYLWLQPHPPAPPEIPPPVIDAGNAPVTNAGNGPVAEAPSPSGSQSQVARLLNQGLKSVGPNYRGQHSHFNDEPPLFVLVGLLLACGVGTLISNQWAKAKIKGKSTADG